MIPMRILSKMGVYRIQKQGVTIDVKLVDNEALVEQGLSELKSQIGTLTAVGLLLKDRMLQLCVGTRCLLVQLHVLGYIPQCIKDFLADKEICFVGVGMDYTRRSLIDDHGIKWERGIEVCELAARIVKKPNVWSPYIITNLRAIQLLAAAVGVSLEESPNQARFSWNGRTSFTDEEMKCVIHEVYASHLIGNKVLAML